jgi:hypothetical protein
MERRRLACAFSRSVDLTAHLKAALIVFMSMMLLAIGSCKGRSRSEESAALQRGDPSRAGEQIIAKYRALASYQDMTMKLRAKITESDDTVRVIKLTIYRKHLSNGDQVMLIEFTHPPEERDRNGLIRIGSGGEIEATRYMQGMDSFIIARSASSEDSLFGLSLQEIVDGQPEKYTYKLIGEEPVGQTPAYRIEGKLKQGADSKFPRVVMLIAKDSFVPISVEFYESPADLARRVVVNRIQQVSGYWTRIEWSVDNRERNKKIEFEALDVKYDQNIPDSIFTREQLKRLTRAKALALVFNWEA